MNRVITGLNEGWRFHYGDVPQAWYRGFDDGEWEQVFLPHDWSVHMPFNQGYSSGTGYLAGGIGWYRVRFSLPEAYRGKRVRVVFDGIYKNSRIWCNSYHLGKRPYGYSEISYDITDFVNFGETDNQISVSVTHTDLADSRWFTGSGITRKAYLVIEEAVHPVWHGTCFRTISVENDLATVSVSSELINESSADCIAQVCFVLKDQEQNTAAEWSQQLELEAGETKQIEVNGVVEQPKLWSLEAPQLYQLETEISVNQAEAYLADVQTVGIRTIQFDADKGFFLNGKETVFKGVCVHHDGGCLGAAMYKEVWLRRLLKLKEAGCNAIRTSHNPHMPELYDLCDELGFLMMDEAFDEWENPKNKWWQGHNVYPPKHEGYAEDFPQWYEADLVTMIRRDWNHPSIVMWSIGNEIDYPNDPYCHPYFESMTGNNDKNKPAAERRYDKNKPNAERLTVIAKKLSRIVKQQDASRPVTLAAAFPELSSRIGLFEPLDVVGYNYKEQWYEQDHERFPDKPFLGSENGHGYLAWRAVTDHPYISGQFLWTGIDYLGEARGWPVHGSYAGIIDLAGNEKAGYYRRKALWTDKPYACLLTAPDDGKDSEWKPLSASWNYEEGRKLIVRCFHNLKQAELFLNGNSCGCGEYKDAYGCVQWSITYEHGCLKAVCTGAQSETVEASLETASEPVRFEAKIWESPVSGRNEIMQIEICLKDEMDRLVSHCDQVIQVEVEQGTLLGLENGDLRDLTSYTENWRSTYEGRLIIFVKEKAGCRIRISCDALNQNVELA